MPDDLVVLSASDILVLKDIINQVRSDPKNTRLRGKHVVDNTGSPDVYLAYSQTGISAPIPVGTSTGSIGAGDETIFDYDPSALIYQLDQDISLAHPVDGLTKTVFATEEIPPNTFFNTWRDKFGTWWGGNVPSASSVSAGASFTTGTFGLNNVYTNVPGLSISLLSGNAYMVYAVVIGSVNTIGSTWTGSIGAAFAASGPGLNPIPTTGGPNYTVCSLGNGLSDPPAFLGYLAVAGTATMVLFCTPSAGLTLSVQAANTSVGGPVASIDPGSFILAVKIG